MPIRVKCPGCSKVLNAPSAAAGKAVKCPDCQARVPVPGEEGSGAQAVVTASGARKASSRKPVKGAKPDSAEGFPSESFLANLSEDAVEDQSQRVCPKCGAPAEEEDEECGECGVLLSTGQLSEKRRRKMALKGPDPNAYYGVVWSDCWQFLLKNKSLAFRGGLYQFFIVCLCLPAAGAFTNWCTNIPPKAFGALLTVMFTLASAGWNWFLVTEIVAATMEKKVLLKRVNFDMFLSVALGVKYYLWLIVFTLPVVLLFGGIAAATRNPWIAVAGTPVILLFMVMYPGVMAHMSMPIQWRGWALPVMARVFGKTAGQQLYWLVVMVATLLISLAPAAIPAFILFVLAPTLAKLAGLTLDANFPVLVAPMSTVVGYCLLPVGLVSAWAICVIWSAWWIFNCRSLGQFTYYCKDRLELQAQAFEKKYVAREIKYGKDGRPIEPINWGQLIVAIFGGLVVLYILINVVLYFATGGKTLLMPDAMRKAFGIP